MHFPNEKGKEQKDILQHMFDNKDPITRLPMATGASSYDKRRLDEKARLKIWKTLRELDTMPVFIPHLEEELCNLLQQNTRINVMKKAMQDLLKEWEDK